MRTEGLKRMDDYISDVISGKIIVPGYVTMAVQRHLTDLETGIDRGLYFDKKEANRSINFFSHLRQSKGKKFRGLPLRLEGWQAFIVGSIFGWRRANGLRRFTYVYVEVPKKNGKTTLAAGIALRMLGFDKESRPEVYTVAKDRGQARICFEEAQNMIKISPEVRDYLQVWRHTITCEMNGGKMEPLSKDSDKKEGMASSCVINDEYHLQVDNITYDNLISGMASREQPMMFTITTAGYNINSPCYNERKVCIDILEGRKQQDDKFAIIYTADEGDDWKEPKVWQKVNPNWNVSVNPERIESEFKDAMNNPTKIPSFKTKHLDIWTTAAENFIKDEDWMKCAMEIDMDYLKGKEAIAAIDLASGTTDINAMVLMFPEGKHGVPDILPFFWISEKKMMEKADRVDYIRWVNEGYIFLHPGEVIDIDRQVSEIKEILGRYSIIKFLADPWRVNDRIGQLLQKAGIKLLGYGQKFKDMDAPTKELERLILTRGINHGGNPVLRWMNSNVVIQRNYEGFIKIVKDKVTEKVDGMVALVMAIGGWINWLSGKDTTANEIYDKQGIQTL